jgi:hypothetical protein
MGRVMVFNVTFNNISVISWRPVLFVEETRVPVENPLPFPTPFQILPPNFVLNQPSPVLNYFKYPKGCRRRDCMVVRFTTTYAISDYHH